MPRFATIIALCAALAADARALPIGPTVEEPPAPAQVVATSASGADQPEPRAPLAAAAASKPLERPASATPDSMRPLGKPGPTPTGIAGADTESGEAAPAGSMPAWASQVLALAGVVAIIFIVGSLVRRFAPAAGLMGALGPRGRAPSGVLEVLGRYPVSRHGLLVLIKVDRRILLVSQTGGRAGHRMETLTEITDPAEVASLVAKTADRDATGRLFDRAMERFGGDARPVASASPAAEPATLDGSVAARTLRARLATLQAASSPAATPAARVAQEFTA